MPYLTNSIGSKAFADITGPVNFREEQVEVLNRPGVDGSGIRKLGARGMPFELVTKRFHADFTAAYDAITNVTTGYKTMIATTSYTLTIHGVNLGDFYVLEVQEVATFAVLNPCGNVPASTDTVCQVCKWKLLG